MTTRALRVWRRKCRHQNTVISKPRFYFFRGLGGTDEGGLGRTGDGGLLGVLGGGGFGSCSVIAGESITLCLDFRPGSPRLRPSTCCPSRLIGYIH